MCTSGPESLRHQREDPRFQGKQTNGRDTRGELGSEVLSPRHRLPFKKPSSYSLECLDGKGPRDVSPQPSDYLYRLQPSYPYPIGADKPREIHNRRSAPTQSTYSLKALDLVGNDDCGKFLRPINSFYVRLPSGPTPPNTLRPQLSKSDEELSTGTTRDTQTDATNRTRTTASRDKYSRTLPTQGTDDATKGTFSTQTNSSWDNTPYGSQDSLHKTQHSEGPESLVRRCSSRPPSNVASSVNADATEVSSVGADDTQTNKTSPSQRIADVADGKPSRFCLGGLNADFVPESVPSFHAVSDDSLCLTDTSLCQDRRTPSDATMERDWILPKKSSHFCFVKIPSNVITPQCSSHGSTQGSPTTLRSESDSPDKACERKSSVADSSVSSTDAAASAEGVDSKEEPNLHETSQRLTKTIHDVSAYLLPYMTLLNGTRPPDMSPKPSNYIFLRHPLYNYPLGKVCIGPLGVSESRRGPFKPSSYSLKTLEVQDIGKVVGPKTSFFFPKSSTQSISYATQQSDSELTPTSETSLQQRNLSCSDEITEKIWLLKEGEEVDVREMLGGLSERDWEVMVYEVDIDFDHPNRKTEEQHHHWPIMTQRNMGVLEISILSAHKSPCIVVNK